MVGGGVERPTFRFSGVANAQLGDNGRAWRDAFGCPWQALAAAIAVIVAVSASVRQTAGTTLIMPEEIVFEGFALERIDVGGAELRVRYGGSGPPVLPWNGPIRTPSLELVNVAGDSAVGRDRIQSAPNL